MVSWYADGGVSGFNPSLAEPYAEQYSLASNGSVDVNGVTRLQYALGGTWIDRIDATARLTTTAADLAANPRKDIGASMFVVPASAFPAGQVPTPTQILAAGSGVRVFRGQKMGNGAGSYQRVIKGPRAATLTPNTKYWVLVLPSAWTPGSTPSVANDKPMRAGQADTIGRALSMWTNRTPAAPTITAPLTGTSAVSGEEITFSFTVKDPDQIVGGTDYSHDDLAGVHVQYAARPTAANPNPEWRDLPIMETGETGIYGEGDGWYIHRASANDGGRRNTGGFALWANRTMKIKVGGHETRRGMGVLPSGDWQIRMRTFDWGHPYPGNGAPPFNNASGNYTAHTAPAANTSPWSTPVTLSVSAQVPAPIPSSPTQGHAISYGEPVTLSWQYRNTARPAYPQEARTVQIRKVGDPEWTTLVSGNSRKASHRVDQVTPPLPEVTNYMSADPGFENGTLGGWTVGAEGPGSTLTPITNNPHSGNVSVRINYGGTGLGVAYFHFTPNMEHDQFHLSGWVRPNPDPSGALDVSLVWYDRDGMFIDWASADSGQMTEYGPLFRGQTWQHAVIDAIRPPGGVTAHVTINTVVGTQGGEQFDDFTLVSTTSPATVFLLEESTEYEWRVQVTDGNGVVSDWSAPARFWVVPAPASGETRPLPSETIDGATLGCGRSRVFIYRRGGRDQVGEISGFTHLDWERVRDDISTSGVVVSDWDIDCGKLLARLEPWAYEVVIYRDNGYSNDRVWEGPITLLTYEYNKVTIHAKDVMAYAYRRIIKQAMVDKGSTVTSRAQRVLQNALAPDDPNVLPYLTVLAQPDDATQYRSLPAYSRTAFEEVDDMAANAGLDYTAIGRAILLWGTKHRIGTLPEFRDEDLGTPPIVSVYGMQMANRYAVSDGNGVYGEADRLDEFGRDEVYGLVEMLSSTWASDSEEEFGTYTQASRAETIKTFEGYAERSISDRYPPPVVVRVPDNTTLNPGASISIQQLVPGVVVPLRSTSTLRNVVGSQKLDSVKVVEEAGSETISITLSAFSRDDAAMGEGEGE